MKRCGSICLESLNPAADAPVEARVNHPAAAVARMEGMEDTTPALEATPKAHMRSAWKRQRNWTTFRSKRPKRNVMKNKRKGNGT